MAIFGRADADLSLVTQAFQVDTDDLEELREFWVRCASLWQMKNGGDRFAPPDLDESGLIGMVALDAEIRIAQALREQPSVGKAEAFGSYGLYLLDRLRQVCRRIRLIMVSLADRGVLPYGVLLELRSKYSSDPKLQPMIRMDELVEGGPGDLPFVTFISGSMLDASRPELLLVSELESLLLDLFWRTVELRRCVECGSVYSSQRAGQRYCSHRCSTRVSTRESVRRAREK